MIVISVKLAWTDNEFEQTWEVSEGGKLVCAHVHIAHEPAQRGGSIDESYSAYDYCEDCGAIFNR